MNQSKLSIQNRGCTQQAVLCFGCQHPHPRAHAHHPMPLLQGCFNWPNSESLPTEAGSWLSNQWLKVKCLIKLGGLQGAWWSEPCTCTALSEAAQLQPAAAPAWRGRPSSQSSREARILGIDVKCPDFKHWQWIPIFKIALPDK